MLRLSNKSGKRPKLYVCLIDVIWHITVLMIFQMNPDLLDYNCIINHFNVKVVKKQKSVIDFACFIFFMRPVDNELWINN